MIELQYPQLSEEWVTARIGLPTASHFKEVVTQKGEQSKQITKYMYTLVGELLSGKKKESYSNKHMERGILFEPEARSLYSVVNEVDVDIVSLCYQDERKLWGASSDGLVGKEGLVEIKCCDLEIVVECLDTKKPPSAYSFQQCQGQMMVLGRKWCDLWVYYQGLPPFKMRVDRDDVFIGKLQNELEKLSMDITELVAKIQNV